MSYIHEAGERREMAVTARGQTGTWVCGAGAVTREQWAGTESG